MHLVVSGYDASPNTSPPRFFCVPRTQPDLGGHARSSSRALSLMRHFRQVTVTAFLLIPLSKTSIFVRFSYHIYSYFKCEILHRSCSTSTLSETRLLKKRCPQFRCSWLLSHCAVIAGGNIPPTGLFSTSHGWAIASSELHNCFHFRALFMFRPHIHMQGYIHICIEEYIGALACATGPIICVPSAQLMHTVASK